MEVHSILRSLMLAIIFFSTRDALVLIGFSAAVDTVDRYIHQSS